MRMAFEGLGAIIPHHSRKSHRLLQAQAMVAHASDDLVNHYAKSVAAMLSGKRTNFCIVQRCWDSTPATLELGQYEATRVDGGFLRLWPAKSGRGGFLVDGRCWVFLARTPGLRP